MKKASALLVEFLASQKSEVLRVADLYTITLTNGIVLRYTSADFDIMRSGAVYSCKNAGISRSEMSWQTGLSVDDVTVELCPSKSDTVGGVPLIQAFRNGSFDGAEFRIDMAFYKEGWENEPLFLDKLFVGTVDVDTISPAYIKCNIKSFTELLNVSFPCHVYQPSCCYALYGAGCGVNKTKFSETSFVKTASTNKQLNCDLKKAAGYYQNGVVTFLSGKNINVKKSVKIHSNGVLKLSTPLQYLPAEGDKFSVAAGCNKTIAMCAQKFNNRANFSGTPFVPKAETTAKF